MTVSLALGLSVVALCTPLVLAGMANTYYGIRYRLPFVPSTKSAIHTMFSYALIREGVTFLDLGSGTGDILIAAAQRGARSVGIEVNPFLVWFTRVRVKLLGLSDRVTVLRGDIFSMPLPHADVVTMYLPSTRTLQLQRTLESFPSHSRIISRGFEMPGWKKYAGTSDVHAYRVEDMQNYIDGRRE